MIFLSLEKAQILECKGFNKIINPNQKFRIEMAEQGMLNVYTRGLFGGGQKAFWFMFHVLELNTWTNSIRTGGGFVGGGFGLTGAATGMLEAAALNLLTTRQREYSMLGVFATLPDGSKKHIVFGFRNLDESTLRTQLSSALTKWADDYIKYFIPLVEKTSNEELNEEVISASFNEIDTMLFRGMLNVQQHATLQSVLEARGKRPTSGLVGANQTDRVAQLNTLAALRASRALTEDEFQHEKSRILNS